MNKLFRVQISGRKDAPMTERPSSNVLTRDANVISFEHQRAKSQRLGKVSWWEPVSQVGLKPLLFPS
jgi:hypothetical protein